MTVLEQSSTGKLDKVNIIKTFRFMGIVALGGALTALANFIPNVHFEGESAAIATIILSSLIELARKIFTDYSKKYKLENIENLQQPA